MVKRMIKIATVASFLSVAYASPSYAFTPSTQIFCYVESPLGGNLFDLSSSSDGFQQNKLNIMQPDPVIGPGLECGYEEVDSPSRVSRITADFFVEDDRYFLRTENQTTPSSPVDEPILFSLNYLFQQEVDRPDVIDFKLIDGDFGVTPSDELLESLQAAPSGLPEILDRFGVPLQTQFTSNSLTINTPTVFLDPANPSSFALFEIIVDDSSESQTSVPEPGVLLGLVGAFGLGCRRLTRSKQD